jgi:flavin reductase (DIM6/NTAB) family NADH-FMN oxidoreductase RutF
VNQDQNAIGAALGRMVNGCAVLGVQQDGTRNGLLVSWFQQAAFEPPMLTASLKAGRPALALIGASQRFALSILPETAGAVIDHFSKEFSTSDDAFAGLNAANTDWGPTLKDAIATLGCEMVQRVEAGDHIVLLAKVVAGEGDASASPLVHLRQSGFSY